MRTRRLLVLIVLSLVALTAPTWSPTSVLADQSEGRTAAVVDDQRLIAAGGQHTCAVLDTGTVQCWGNNALGQLGNGTTAATTVPVGVSGLSGVLAVTAGATHSCALVYGGTVTCWGNNGSGQLGNGTTTDSLVPVPVTGISTATAIAAGGFHTCAVLAAGTLQCWGVDGSGQLGDGGATEKSTTPVAVTGITTAVAVAAGEFHTCALLADGTARCWGHNGSGQLGNSTLVDSSTPVAVSGITAADAAKALTAGHSHTCAVLNSGKAQCWGLNFFGQLGNGVKGDGSDSQVPVTVKYDQNAPVAPPDPVDLTGVTAITAGQYHSCALLVSGTARCWGQNGRGQLGNGATPSGSGVLDDKVYAAPVVTDVGSTTALGGIRALTAGGFHTCVLVTGGMRCWGYNFYGQLGAYEAQRSVPVVVTALSGADTVSVGTGFACAIRMATAGTGRPAVCWGSNADGRLGAGPGAPATTTIPLVVSGISDFGAVDAGNGHACALPAGSSTPSCWGWNQTGQLGDDSTSSSSVPVTVSGLTVAEVVSAGGADVGVERGLTCARTTTGEARCWGRNFFGQVGDGTTIDRDEPAVVKRDVDPDADVDLQPITGVTDITAGGGHACAVVANGEVLCWGWNGAGQLGDDTQTSRSSAVYVLTDPSTDPPTRLTGATAVVAGAQHTCARMGDGTLRCWGANGSGQVGDNSTTMRKKPVTVSGITTLDPATLLTAGDVHTCSMVASGHVYCWGENGSGQLGDSSTTDRKVPTEVYNSTLGPADGLVLVTALSAGRTNTCARLIDTTVMCTGDNAFGQLGDGVGAYRTAPIAVTSLAPLGGNHIPHPVDDVIVVPVSRTPQTIALTGNDADPDADGLTVTAVSTPSHGTAVLSGSDVTYSPNDAVYCGPDEFFYTVSDGTASVTARVAVTVTCPPRPPAAVADSATTDEDSAVTVDVTANDSDPDGDLLTLVSATDPASGSTSVIAGAVQYTPDLDFCGADAFDYTVQDPGGLTATAAVAVTVSCTPDAPVGAPDADTTDEDTPLTIDVLANDSDADAGDNATLLVLSVSDPAHGTAVIVSGGIRYTPDADYCDTSPDTFTYVVQDRTGATAAGSVTVLVLCQPDQLHAVDDAATTAEDVPVVVDVLANDHDPDGGAISILSVTTPLHGSAVSNAGATVTYTPAPDFCGADTFGYTITDGSRTADAVVVPVAVTCSQDAPDAVPDGPIPVSEQTPVGIHVLGNDVDVDGDVIAVESVTTPANGTATITTGGFVTYRGAVDFCGPDTFSYTITDGHGGTDTAAVTVEVECVNDLPVIDAIPPLAGNWGDPLGILLTASDADADTLSYSLVDPPASAGVDSGTGVFVWTPSSSQVGVHTITVRVDDGTSTVDETFTATVGRRPVSVSYAGPASGQYSDWVTVSGRLTDSGFGTGIAARPMTFQVGALSGSGLTDASGDVGTSIRLTEPAGVRALSASFAGDAAYLPGSDTASFTVGKESVTVVLTGRHLTLTTATSAPVSLSATVSEADDGWLGNALAGIPLTFRSGSGTGPVLCTTTLPASTTGTAVGSCSAGTLTLGSRVVTASISSPTYAGLVDVGVVVVAQAGSGSASGGGRVIDPEDSSPVSFGFRAIPQRKSAPLGEVVHVHRSATTATVMSGTPSGVTRTCSNGKPRVCDVTINGAGLTRTDIDLATGTPTSIAGASAITVWATDAAEPVGSSVPPDRYAASITGAVTRAVGSASSRLLLQYGNVRVP